MNRMEAVIEVMKAIGKPAKGDRGETRCPVCGKALFWRYGGPRSLAATCSTPNCLTFMS
jgi:predicted RNA-binding Zn-ribbon protein involved in translation (DUF1610 family)